MKAYGPVPSRRCAHAITYGALFSQLIVAAWLSVSQYYSLRNLIFIRVKCKKNSILQGWVLPAKFSLIFAPWYDCLIHPLFVGVKALLPSWIAALLGSLIIFFSLLVGRPAISGRFIPVKDLPAWGQVLSFFPSLTHTIELVRCGFGGDNFFGIPLNVVILNRFPLCRHALTYHKLKERMSIDDYELW